MLNNFVQTKLGLPYFRFVVFFRIIVLRRRSRVVENWISLRFYTDVHTIILKRITRIEILKTLTGITSTAHAD